MYKTFLHQYIKIYLLTCFDYVHNFRIDELSGLNVWLSRCRWPRRDGNPRRSRRQVQRNHPAPLCARDPGLHPVHQHRGRQADEGNRRGQLVVCRQQPGQQHRHGAWPRPPGPVGHDHAQPELGDPEPVPTAREHGRAGPRHQVCGVRHSVTRRWQLGVVAAP